VAVDPFVAAAEEPREDPFVTAAESDPFVAAAQAPTPAPTKPVGAPQDVSSLRKPYKQRIAAILGPNVDLNDLHPEAQRALTNALEEAKAAGITATITSARRSTAKQQELWENRHRNPNPVARPGTSRHEHGEAFDISVPVAQRNELNKIMGKWGFLWGGTFKRPDFVHYQWKGTPKAAAPAQPRGPAVKTPPPPTTGRMTLDQAAAAAAAALPDSGPDPRSAAAGFQFLGRQMGRPANAVTAGLNEMERRAAEARARGERTTLGPFDVDIPGALSDVAAGARAGARAFRSGEPQEVTFLRSALGLKPESANPTLYGLVTAGEQILPFLYDPLNVVAGPMMRGVGKALAPGASAVERATVKGGAALARGTGRLTGVLAGSEVGTTATERALSLVPTPVQARLGQHLVDTVIQPALRHKEELQGIIRETHGALKKHRLLKPAQQAGDNPIYDLALQHAIGPTPAARQAAVQTARVRGIPAQIVTQTSTGLLRAADDTLARLQALGKNPLTGGVTRQDWLQAFFATQDGVPAGLQMTREVRLAEIARNLRRFAADLPGPGLAKVPDKIEFGSLRGKYFPTEVTEKVKALFEPAQEPNLYFKGVRAVKNLYLAQPFTPAKNLLQNVGGVNTLMQRHGGTALEAAAEAPGATRDLLTYWRTGRLSQAMREWSDFDPTFLQRLEHVRIVPETKPLVAGPLTLQTGRLDRLKPWASDHVFLQANGGVDQFAKLTAFKALRARGVPVG
jgi:hypothetical protein